MYSHEHCMILHPKQDGCSYPESWSSQCLILMAKCCHYLIPDTHKIPSSREQNVTRKIPSPTLLRAEFAKSYSPPVQLYGSSGIWPLGHLHRYEPTVFSQIVCPLQWWPYFPPFVRHSLTSEMKNQIK